MKVTKRFEWTDYLQSATELIVQDMLNVKLLDELKDSGHDKNIYGSRISNCVLMLAGIPEPDRTQRLKDLYSDKLQQVFKIDITDEAQIFHLANQILAFLSSWKPSDETLI